ncbi:hypothetical protein G9P44_002167 [Scheffersomyces stipitis]|nr:hypothetical protein G9P44_002167 [Scheffersomyces stipitis]
MISSEDLYLLNSKMNSAKRITYDGIKPSFYDRSAIDFESDFFHRCGLGNNTVLSHLHNEQDFEARISPRTDIIQRFVGTQFPLSLEEKIGILCGLSTFHLDIRLQAVDERRITFPTDRVLIETDRIRAIGKHALKMLLDVETVFMNERYLSSSTKDIFDSLDFFNNEQGVIPEFMKRNLLYNCILPYRGAMKFGRIADETTYAQVKAGILDRTSIGSLYTMIGLLTIKFDRQKVRESFLLKKVIHGGLGIINLTSEALTRS